MEEFSTFIDQYGKYAVIFMLMLSTFLIGYFSSWWFQKSKYKSIIESLNKKIVSLMAISEENNKRENVKDIETIFTEIKPKIIKVVKEAQEELKEAQTPQRVALKARTSYVTYTKSKPNLDFENFGRAGENEKDDLTELNGIGPYIEQKLNEIGIYTFDQISRLSIQDIRSITELIDFFPGRIERDNWVGQANTLKLN